MNKRKSKSPPKNKPLDIAEHPIQHKVRGAKVAPEIISEYQEIKQVSPKKQLPSELEEYKWRPGQSGNLSGRPKDIIKEIGKRIMKTRVGKVLNPKERKLAEDMDFQPDEITVLENMLLQMAMSKNPAKNIIFLERVFGKVPDINFNVQVNDDIVRRFRSKLTDAELERIVAGEDPLDILLEKIPDVDVIEIVDSE